MREDPEQAYAEALRRIRAWREGEALDLSIPGLERLPPEIRDLTRLRELKVAGDFPLHTLPLQDLSPLRGLSALIRLNCSYTQVSDLTPLAAMKRLEVLDCSGTKISDLSPLAELTNLRHLNCFGAPLTDLTPLARLTNLRFLSCQGSTVPDLAPLAHLTALETLHCADNRRISDLGPLAGLTQLKDLDCSGTNVADLSPLTKLTSLISLECALTEVTDLASLAGLEGLTRINCHQTGIVDLKPLSNLIRLKFLDIANTQISNLWPLVDLTALRFLDCSGAKLTSLIPLDSVWSLEVLHARGLGLVAPPPPGRWFNSTLNFVDLSGTRFPDVPAEILDGENGLPALRAHLTDLGETPEPLEEARLMILGNGRIGKTQLRRRLCGEAYDPSVPSTHGIVVAQAPVPDHEAGRFHIWDFGGQEIYHGIHALFLRSRAVFLLGWTPEAEAAAEHEHDGLIFRNHPLPYWINQVGALAGAEAPLLLVQTQCDSPQDRREIPEAARTAAAPFAHQAHLTFSAFKNRGRGALEEALAEAYAAIPKPLIGEGRGAVKREVERLIAEYTALPPERRRHPMMERKDFEALCTRMGGVSDPGLFLRFLHDCGAIFYQDGLFGGRILLDQNWALEAIYALFERDSVYPLLLEDRGRFTRQRLGLYLWDQLGHSHEDQRLFLDMMQACGICFAHEGKDERTVYIAPDLLPLGAPARVEEIWRGGEEEERLETPPYPIPPDFLMRGLIYAIGEKARFDGDYWREGLHVYDARRRTRARADLVDDEAGARIRLRAQGPHAADLLDWLAGRLERAEAAYGLKVVQEVRRRAIRPVAEPRFAADPLRCPTVYISYAREKAAGPDAGREASVKAFQDLAQASGFEPVRDRSHVAPGDRISAFTKRYAEADFVAIFLSDAYLRSIYCMSELYVVWLRGGFDAEAFLRRAAVLLLEGEESPRIATQEGRDAYARHWADWAARRRREVAESPDPSPEDLEECNLLHHLSAEIPKLLTLIRDLAKIRSAEDLLARVERLSAERPERAA